MSKTDEFYRLAQCGAVILRTMEMLENEIEDAEGAK